MEAMSFRTILSWVTLGLVVLIVFLSRKELQHAWELLGTVNLAILALLIPMQLVAYFAAGETMFSYLRGKGTMRKVNKLEQARMALEMNFVNHTLPSGGVSGISYMTWRLSKFDVSAGKAASAQVVRYVAGFIASIILVPLAVVAVTVDGNVNRWIILVSALLVMFMVAASVGLVYLVASRSRMQRFAQWVTVTTNRLVRKLTRGKRRVVAHEKPILKFFEEMHDDYLELRRDRRVLKQPILWALLFTLVDGMLFWVSFWGLGAPVNPAPILIGGRGGIVRLGVGGRFHRGDAWWCRCVRSHHGGIPGTGRYRVGCGHRGHRADACHRAHHHHRHRVCVLSTGIIEIWKRQTSASASVISWRW